MKITLQLVLLQHFRTVHRQIERCEIICGNFFLRLDTIGTVIHRANQVQRFSQEEGTQDIYDGIPCYLATAKITNVLVISTVFHALFFVANDDKGNYVKKQQPPHPLNMYMNEKRQQWSNTWRASSTPQSLTQHNMHHNKA